MRLPQDNHNRSSFRQNFHKVLKGGVLLCAVVLIGVLGYMLIERWRPLEALYMTIITITTVGYGEINEVSETGRIFTIGLIVMGIGVMAYVLGMVAQLMVEVQIREILGRRRLGSRIKSMKDHYIVCGYGRLGKIIAKEFKIHKIPFLVIEANPEMEPALEQISVPYIIDDATNEDVLLEAGLERAKGLVAVVFSDADNVFITMGAKGINPALFVLARADDEKTEKKLLRAGANRVVLPYLIGGQRMAHAIIKPAVSDFLELTAYDSGISLEIGELLVEDQSTLNGVTLVKSGIRKMMDVIIVAILKKDGQMKFNPASQTRIEAGDTLIALGQIKDLEKLAEISKGSPSQCAS